MRSTPSLKVTSAALLAAASLALALPATPAHAQQSWYGPEYQQCSNLSTSGIVQCVSNLTRNWDARLNAAYNKIMSGLPPAGKTKLRAAQRLWIKYRDANCGYYAFGQGTIVRVEAAECLRIMTANRASEMEQILRP